MQGTRRLLCILFSHGNARPATATATPIETCVFIVPEKANVRATPTGFASWFELWPNFLQPTTNKQPLCANSVPAVVPSLPQDELHKVHAEKSSAQSALSGCADISAEATRLRADLAVAKSEVAQKALEVTQLQAAAVAHVGGGADMQRKLEVRWRYVMQPCGRQRLAYADLSAPSAGGVFPHVRCKNGAQRRTSRSIAACGSDLFVVPLLSHMQQLQAVTAPLQAVLSGPAASCAILPAAHSPAACAAALLGVAAGGAACSARVPASRVRRPGRRAAPQAAAGGPRHYAGQGRQPGTGLNALRVSKGPSELGCQMQAPCSGLGCFAGSQPACLFL